MSSPSSAPPLRLEPRPSPRLIALLWAAHLGGALLLVPLPLPLPLKLLLLLLLAASLYRCRQVVAPGEYRWGADGEWSGPVGEPLRLSGESFVAPWLTVINLRARAGRGRRTLVLLPDSLDGETLRRLRVRLRLEAGHEAE